MKHLVSELMIDERDFADLEFHLRTRHHLSLADVEPTDVPGYWRIKEPCAGRAGGCREPIHQFLRCDGPMNHSVSYYDPWRDEHGRWASPYRTWQRARGKE